MGGLEWADWGSPIRRERRRGGGAGGGGGGGGGGRDGYNK